MPTDPRKRQKKQERRAAKRKSKHRDLARQKNAGIAERLDQAARYPVLHCWVTTDLWNEGMGYVCVSRQLPNAMVAFAVFLVDRYCLGVKNALMDVRGRSTYEAEIERKMRSQFTAEPLEPADARKLVESAVEYARDLGFPPHPDYLKARHIFGDIDPAQSTREFEFGKDGKPLYIAGPNDTLARSNRIVRTLEQRCGPGNFHSLIPVAPDTEVLGSSSDNDADLLGMDDGDDLEEEGDSAGEEPAGQP